MVEIFLLSLLFLFCFFFKFTKYLCLVQFLVVLLVLILGLIKIAMDLHFLKKSFRHVQILKLLDYFHFIFFFILCHFRA